jgi:hypothetical protein
LAKVRTSSRKRSKRLTGGPAAVGAPHPVRVALDAAERARGASERLTVLSSPWPNEAAFLHFANNSETPTKRAYLLDKLAQLLHASEPSEPQELTDELDATGETVENETKTARTLRRRCSNKFIDTTLKASLARLIDSPLRMSYQSSLSCADELVQGDGKITSTYCNQRWCSVCGTNRTGKGLNRYGDEIESWITTSDLVTRQPGGAYMLTLTFRSVTAGDLAEAIDQMLDGFNKIRQVLRRTGVALVQDDVFDLYGELRPGPVYRLRWQAAPATEPKRPTIWRELLLIRKLECTYNAVKDSYHPHLHILLNDLEAAEAMVEAWLNLFPTRATVEAQNIRAIDARSAKELFKYFTKVITPSATGPEAKEKMRERRRLQSLNRWRKENGLPLLDVPDLVPGVDYHIYPQALDAIFLAMRGRRIMQSCGIPGLESADDDDATADLATVEATDFRSVVYTWDEERGYDWRATVHDLDKATGELVPRVEHLTGWEPRPLLRALGDAIVLPPGTQPLRLVEPLPDLNAPEPVSVAGDVLTATFNVVTRVADRLPPSWDFVAGEHIDRWCDLAPGYLARRLAELEFTSKPLILFDG